MRRRRGRNETGRGIDAVEEGLVGGDGGSVELGRNAAETGERRRGSERGSCHVVGFGV
jgi:hypothetical protein